MELFNGILDMWKKALDLVCLLMELLGIIHIAIFFARVFPPKASGTLQFLPATLFSPATQFSSSNVPCCWRPLSSSVITLWSAVTSCRGQFFLFFPVSCFPHISGTPPPTQPDPPRTVPLPPPPPTKKDMMRARSNPDGGPPPVAL